MDNLRLFLSILVCFLMNTKQKISALQTIYVDDSCKSWKPSTPIIYNVGSTMTAGSSGILKASRYDGYQGNLNCTIILKPKYSGGIILSIRKIDFRYYCRDNITFSDSYKLNKVYCNYWNYPNEEKSFSSKGDMIITYQTGKDASYYVNGFELTYTAYNTLFPCASSEFRCPVGCIWRNLRCDGHNHCGDRRDQENCSVTEQPSTIKVVSIIGIVFSVCFLILAIGSVIVYYKKEATENSTTVPNIHRPPGTEGYSAHHFVSGTDPQPEAVEDPPPHYSTIMEEKSREMNNPPPPYSSHLMIGGGHDNLSFQ